MSGKSSIFTGGIGNPRILRIILILSPAIFILILELLRYLFFDESYPIIAGSLLLIIVIIFSIFFSRLVFRSMARTEQDYIRRNRELSILNEVALTVNESLDQNIMLPRTLDKLIRLVKADYADLFLINEKTRELIYTSHVGISEEMSEQGSKLLKNEGLVREVSSSNEIEIIQDLKISDNAFATPMVVAGFGSMAVIPLKSSNGNIGALRMLSCQPGQFKTGDVNLFTNINNLIAMAIENSRRYEKVQAMAVAEERERISKELHDGLAQVLGFVITKSQATRQILRKISVANDYLVELENVAQDVYTDTREDILGLRTAISGDRDMVSALREYLKRFSQMHGIKTTLEVGDQIIPSLSPQVELQAIRIIQEALSNIRKHAEATQALVKVSVNGNEVILVIEDDGKGFDIDKLGQNDFYKFGIRTSRERAESIHSRLDIVSNSERGTRVTLSIPVNLPQSSAERGQDNESTNS